MDTGVMGALVLNFDRKSKAWCIRIFDLSVSSEESLLFGE